MRNTQDLVGCCFFIYMTFRFLLFGTLKNNHGVPNKEERNLAEDQIIFILHATHCLCAIIKCVNFFHLCAALLVG